MDRFSHHGNLEKENDSISTEDHHHLSTEVADFEGIISETDIHLGECMSVY